MVAFEVGIWLKRQLNFRKNNLDESRIIWADVQDPITYSIT